MMPAAGNRTGTKGSRTFFAATLLPNRAMLEVFRDAGYEVTSQFEQGTIEVSFSIEPTRGHLWLPSSSRGRRGQRRGLGDEGARPVGNGFGK
jgi:hypothetical protein